jgi:hypothetical protein
MKTIHVRPGEHCGRRKDSKYRLKIQRNCNGVFCCNSVSDVCHLNRRKNCFIRQIIVQWTHGDISRIKHSTIWIIKLQLSWVWKCWTNRMCEHFASLFVFSQNVELFKCQSLDNTATRFNVTCRSETLTIRRVMIRDHNREYKVSVV